jgi:hypothetical protein
MGAMLTRQDFGVLCCMAYYSRNCFLKEVADFDPLTRRKKSMRRPLPEGEVKNTGIPGKITAYKLCKGIPP